jgi:hypothetical protein
LLKDSVLFSMLDGVAANSLPGWSSHLLLLSSLASDRRARPSPFLAFCIAGNRFVSKQRLGVWLTEQMIHQKQMPLSSVRLVNRKPSGGGTKHPARCCTTSYEMPDARPSPTSIKASVYGVNKKQHEADPPHQHHNHGIKKYRPAARCEECRPGAASILELGCRKPFCRPGPEHVDTG